MFQQGGAIKDALDRISTHEYVLPAIQREFVWSPDQICTLFDSLMQGYSYGEFLFWRIEPENSAQYRYYDFVRNYHQRDNPHCPDLGILTNRPLIAILDGQQRLTAFNIGLRGSMAVKLPRRWWSSPDAFPRRVLALDLLATAESDEDGRRYQFDFVDERSIGRQGNRLWFKVAEILTMDAGPDMNDWLLTKGIEGDEHGRAYRVLDRLYRAVHTEQTVAYYEERNQDIEHVLNMFIRRNSGGTTLSYSDLLLSIATSQWDTLDARKEVHQLVDDLNRIGQSGLGLTKDFVLKAGLMLSDISSVGFQVRNFTHDNMEALEANWSKIRDALVETAQLATSFGFDGSSLRASSSLLPIAYYIYRLDAPTDFDTNPRYEQERKAIRGWLIRSILKQGVWGSGLDTLLTALRDVLHNARDGHFPVTEMRRVMAQRGKSVDFSPDEVEDLADMGINDRRIFPLLSVLFPFVNVQHHHFHIDHVFPKSRFTPTRLSNAGVSLDQRVDFADCANRIANLQLLDGNTNTQKQAIMPADWMREHFADDQERQNYRTMYDLGTVPEQITGFMDFYESRRERLQERIAELVNSV